MNTTGRLNDDWQGERQNLTCTERNAFSLSLCLLELGKHVYGFSDLIIQATDTISTSLSRRGVAGEGVVIV
jgi:hypothetical protein